MVTKDTFRKKIENLIISFITIEQLRITIDD
jgi:hypothetical protein